MNKRIMSEITAAFRVIGIINADESIECYKEGERTFAKGFVEGIYACVDVTGKYDAQSIVEDLICAVYSSEDSTERIAELCGMYKGYVLGLGFLESAKDLEKTYYRGLITGKEYRDGIIDKVEMYCGICVPSEAQIKRTSAIHELAAKLCRDYPYGVALLPESKETERARYAIIYHDKETSIIAKYHERQAYVSIGGLYDEEFKMLKSEVFQNKIRCECTIS